ncbi:MAG: methyltransferase domain-containing protein, partial [Bacteroidetes bacterium]
WGAVQVFGPAEHATFREDEGVLYTLARWQMQPGEAVGVSHQLVHQMGNPTDNAFFLSLHVYGTMEPVDNVTGMARLFDLEHALIHRVNGGVFFELPQNEYVRSEPGPEGDFPTRLRHMVELTRRLQKMRHAGLHLPKGRWEEAIRKTFDPDQRAALMDKLEAILDEEGHVDDTVQWRILNHELRVAARLQRDLTGQGIAGADAFEDYARMYDDLICRPCLDGFMRRYLFFFQEKHLPRLDRATVLSVGCGTGLVERFMIDELGVAYDNLYGIDISEAMVREARKRIRADVGDILALDPTVKRWDVVYSGLNVLQYLPHDQLKPAIHKVASVLEPGGWFVGDFITPDHIRWYPNLMRSADGRTVSLRSPKIIEEHGINYQESEIINI